MLKDPEIEKSIIVSTCHVTHHDMKLLEDFTKHPIDGCIVEKSEFRVRIYIGEELKNTDKMLVENGLSHACVELVKMVSKVEGIKWLVLDCDGKVHKEIPKFDW